MKKQTRHGRLVVTWTQGLPEERVLPTVREVVDATMHNNLPWNQRCVMNHPHDYEDEEDPMFEVGYDFPPYDENEARLRELRDEE